MLLMIAPWAILPVLAYATFYHFFTMLPFLLFYCAGEIVEYIAKKTKSPIFVLMTHWGFVIWMPSVGIALLILVSNGYPEMKFGASLGIFLNTVAMLANKGKMPVDIAGYGRGIAETDVTHTSLTKATRLAFLCDRFRHRLFAMDNQPISIGDIISGIAVIATALHIIASLIV